MLWPFGCFFTGGEGGPSAKKRAQVKKHEGIKAIGFSVRLLGCFGFFWGLDVFGGETHHKPPQTSIKNTNLLDNG